MNAKPVGRSGSEGAWVAAIIVIAICLLSSFTLTKGGNATNAAAGGPGGRSSVGGGGDAALGSGDQSTTDGGGTSASGDTTGDASGGGVAGGGGGKGGAAGGGAAGGGGTGVAAGGKKPAAQGSGGIIKAAADCKGNGARASDVGVTANSIEFAATVVKTGVAKDFLIDAQYGMEAVRRQVNQQGGICGRLVNVHTDDDGWNPDNGNQLIQKYISCKCYFGLAVNPSSEGLRNALDSGTIDQAQFPVIGSDGMLIDQYQHPWIWPVATSTHSAGHVIAADAVGTRGAKKIGIVYDANYKFGKEGNDAVVGAATRRGATVVADIDVTAGQTSYKTDVKRFFDKCGDGFASCDFVVMLLEPSTADQWVRDGGLGDGSKHPALGIGVPQPLFLDSFANNCGAPCNGLQAWTGFKAPLPPFDSDSNVAAYRSAVKAVNSAADTNNPEVEGAYQGMYLLVQALAEAGPAPTRQGVKQILDSTTLDTGLGPKAAFNGSNHFAATAVQPFQAVYNNNDFTGWRFPNGAQFISDPEVTKDMPS